MKKRSAAFFCLLGLMFCLAGSAFGQKKSGNEYACVEPNPETVCTVANTCGSGGSACIVDIKKDGTAASITPTISDAKKSKLFCVKSGTQVTFQSTRKNTGFVVDFGTKSPFNREDAIIGGTKKPDSAVASNPGCYRFSAGACVSGATYGMCGNSMAEMVVTK